MEKLFSRRQIGVGFLSLLLLGIAIFLFVTYSQPQTPVLIAGDNLRKRLGTLTDHKTVQWKNTLQSWDTTQHILKSSRSFTFPQGLSQTTIQETIPASSGTLFVEGISHFNEINGSGTYYFTLQANIFSGGNNTISGSVLNTLPESILFSGSLNLIRSGQELRGQLNSLSLSQESGINNFVLISRAYLKQYENTRLYFNNLKQSRIDFIQGNVYNRLALQSKQHIIPANDGSVKIILEGDKNKLDATIDATGLLNGTLLLGNGYSVLLEEKADTNKTLITLFSKKQKKPLGNGYLGLDTANKKLVLTSNFGGNVKETFVYSGTVSSTYTDGAPFTVAIPSQFREWTSAK